MSRFDEMYQSLGQAPWDIGRPQPVILALEESGEIRGRVLDAGCGTGENALYLAARGHEVVGIDFSEPAIAFANDKAAERGIARVSFARLSAHDAGRLEGVFDTVIDVGLFHTFPDEDREPWVDSLRRVTAPGSRYFLMCFSEHEKREGGPRRVTQEEIRDTFAEGFKILSIESARFVSNIHEDGAAAWLARLVRV
ncbi:class I SAM-dependent methyltransferase [bacterium]|nr:class I SAM-dependent methyltransferase [bacterium]